MILKFFGDEVYNTTAYTKPRHYCSGCDPDFQTPTAGPEKLNKDKGQDPLRRPWLNLKLREWRNKKAQEAYHGEFMQYYPSLIMPDTVLTALATWAEYIEDKRSMQQWAGSGWDGIHKERYIIEVLEILERGRKMRPDIGEMFDVWKRHNDVVKKRVPAEGVKKDQIEFEERREGWLLAQGLQPGPRRKGKAAKKRDAGRAEEKAKQPVKGPAIDKGQASGLAQLPGSRRCSTTETVQPEPTGSLVTAAPPKLPSKRRAPMQEVRSHAPREISPSRSRSTRRLPARYCD